MSTKLTVGPAIGTVFFDVTVASGIFPGTDGRSRIQLKCACGKTMTIQPSEFGKAKSCGCRRHDGMYSRTHGMTSTVEFHAWSAMRARCRDSNHKFFHLYGGRGITVCERWQNSFEAFLEDMGKRPSPKHSLDRWPDKDGNYEKSNCRWATSGEQQNNKSTCRYLTIDGKTQTISQWARERNIDKRTLWKRIDRGCTPEMAVTLPRVENGCKCGECCDTRLKLREAFNLHRGTSR